MLRAVTSLPLPGSLHLRLRETGFVYYEDLCDGKGREMKKCDKIEKRVSGVCTVCY